MRLLKPSWVSHDGKPIFSIDIHPDGSRFATGGQGDNAGRIVVWNMAPVKNEKDEKDENVPKMLCQMDNHLACVNCVRWSNNGKYLASGGDDKLVMVWQTSRYAGSSSVFGSDGKMVNLEQWRCVNTLRGHSGDVLDVAWSPQDIWLATCSIDNTIVVWNANKLPEQVVVLKGHTGLVKGVTWDPVGKYLASQSDDKSLRVWRTLDWQQETCVTEPFQECGGTTHVLRLGWSPDGHYLVSAHAMNNSGPTAQIIERNGWKVAMDFVGHRKAVTVVRFNPNILAKKVKRNSEKPQQYSCCAIGSRDRSISIWLTALKRPLVVTHDLFSSSILDISWSQTGMELLCCSWDGTVAYLDFSPDEIGTPLTTEEKNLLHQRTYGKNLVLNAAANAASQIIETTAMLKLHQDKESHPKAAGLTNGSAGASATGAVMTTTAPVRVGGAMEKEASVGSSGPTSTASDSKAPKIAASPNKQIETKTQDGRRRITPIFLAPQPMLGHQVTVQLTPHHGATISSLLSILSRMVQQSGEVPLPFSVTSTPSVNSNSQHGSEGMFTTTREQTKIIIERKDGMLPTTSPTSAAKSTTPTSTSSSMAAASAKKTESGKDKPAQGSSKSDVYDMASIQPITQMAALQGPSCGASTTETRVPDTSTNVIESSVNQDKVRPAVKRRLEPESVPPSPAQPPPKKKDGRGRPRKYPLPEQAKPTVPQPPAPIVAQPTQIIYKTSGLELPVPSIDSVISIQIAGCVGSDSALVVEVENRVTSSLHLLRCTQGGKMTWDSVLSSRVIAVAGNSHVVCAACIDHSLILLSATSGRRLVPPLILDSAASTIRCSGYYVMAVSSRGAVFVWNIQSLSAVIKNESLVSILPNNDVKLVNSLLTEQGLPVITLSTGKSFTFKVDLGCWVLLSSRSDKLQSCSDHQSCLPSVANSRAHVGPLATLQASTERPGSQAMTMFQSNPSLQQPSTLSHLENQVACSLALQSSQEYHFWMLTYIRYLVMQGQERKLREICDELLGPMYRSSSQPKWLPTVLGHNKRKLLGEILPLMGSNLSLQRLFTEYKEQLDTVRT